MDMFTANIKSNPLMRQSSVDHDIARAVRLGGIGFWQEISPSRYKTALRREAGKRGHHMFGSSVECPITLSSATWKPVPDGYHIHKMHKGRLFVSPARYTVEVRTVRTRTNRKIAFFGTHFVSGAWCKPGPGHHHAFKQWRINRWNEHIQKLRTLIAAAHADGYTCIVGMDANRGIGSVHLHPWQQIVVSNGIDGIIVVPAVHIEVTSTKKVVHRGYYTDHAPVSITTTLSAR